MLTKVEPHLQHTSPEYQGIASSAILQFVEAMESQLNEVHSFMLLRHGSVVAEGWWSPYERQRLHMLFSLSKSFTSTAVGLAVAEGHFSVDDTVLSFFPDETPAEVNDYLAAMRVRHLLSMSTGHIQDTMTAITEREGSEWTRRFFEVPVEREPGTHFHYNTGATYMLSAIVQKTTGLMLTDYLQSRLYEPLGIKKAVWEVSPEGINMGGFGLRVTTEDIAKFGQLYLQKGFWQGKQLLPEAWVEEATAFHVSNGDNPNSDWNQGYGYQFWRCQHNVYRGDGAFGQYCIVMPEQDAVLAMTSGLGDMQKPLDLVWELLLPAMQSGTLPEEATAHDKLSKKLSSLSIPPVQGKASSPKAASVSGRSYKVETNEYKIETMTLNFTESGCTFRAKTARGEVNIPCGYGKWQPGQTKLFNEPWNSESAPIVSSGAWTADDTFTMVIRLHETPFYETAVFRFIEDGLTVETRGNVGFKPPETKRLTAHPVYK